MLITDLRRSKDGVRGVPSNSFSLMKVQSTTVPLHWLPTKYCSEFDLFADVTRVVDLCAAPGSWSQVLSRVLIKGEKFGRSAWEDKQEVLRQQLLQISSNTPYATEIKHEVEDKEEKKPELNPRKDVKIVAIDLQPMSPLEGITTLRADITHPATVPLLLHALDPSYEPEIEIPTCLTSCRSRALRWRARRHWTA